MKTGYLYFAIILLQFFVFFNNVSLIIMHRNISVFYLSIAVYAVSVILLIIAVVRGSKAGSGNCFMTLLFIINLFFYFLYSFTNFLGSFVNSVK
jgi:hypothetical protein